MQDSDLLDRISKLLRGEIGPAVDAAYPKTQAYLSAVVLQKLALELKYKDRHEQEAEADQTALWQDLSRLLGEMPSAAQLSRLLPEGAGDDAALCRFIEGLYQHKDEIGEENFTRLIARVRQSLRKAIDRRMEIAS